VLIDDFSQSVSRFEELLQKISSSMTTGVVFEKLPPTELWERSETDVTSAESLAEQLKGLMLTLKPEKVPTIKEQTEALLQPLNSFREILHRGSEDPLAGSRLALEELRKAVVEGSKFLDLAKEVRKKPSESISEVLKLKEVYDAKEYLSAIPVPEATYVRFEGLRKNIKRLELSISNLEQSLGELRDDLDSVVEETMKFRHLSIEESEKKQTKPKVSPEEETGPEPSLVS
jgi:hypothetical protein